MLRFGKDADSFGNHLNASFTTNPVKSLHSKANSDKITHFRKKILLYFEIELADKLRSEFVQQALNKGVTFTVAGTSMPFLGIKKIHKKEAPAKLLSSGRFFFLADFAEVCIFCFEFRQCQGEKLLVIFPIGTKGNQLFYQILPFFLYRVPQKIFQMSILPSFWSMI